LALAKAVEHRLMMGGYVYVTPIIVPE